MAIQFDCPYCIQNISVDESKARARIDCPHCNRPVKVPAKPTHEPPPSLAESSLTSSADTPASRLDSAVSEPPLPPASPPQPAQIPLKRERKIVVVVSLCLILDFVWQLFTPPDLTTFEAASFGRNALWITQAVFMIVVIVGLVGLTIYILKVNGVGAWLVLVIFGFIAGMGLLFIKVSVQLDNEQRKRRSDLGTALAHYDSLSVYLNRNSWMRFCGDTSKYQLIPPQDLRSFNSMSRDALEKIDEVLQQLPASSQEPWRVRRALISACSERAKLFDAYWNDGTQKEAMRLQGEIDALRKQDKELSPKVDEAYERFKSDSR